MRNIALGTPSNKNGTIQFDAVLMVCGSLLIITAVILIVCFLLSGKETVSGQWLDGESTTSLTCEGKNIDYAFFAYDNADKKETKINATFDGSDNLNSISLRQTMYYDDLAKINASETNNHAAMNISFSESGLNADAFNATYTMASDSLKMTLYTTSEKLKTSNGEKYFLLSPTDKTTPTSTKIKKSYESQGFVCTLNEGSN